MRLEISQMYYYKQIVESSFNLTEASRRIHVSQSALSQFINHLENVSNLSLFVRQRNRLTGLTPSGQVLYEQIVDLLTQYEEMLKTLKAATSTEKITITFGAVTSYLQTLFPGLFPQIVSRHPRLSIDLIEGGALDINRRFAEGEFDFGLLVAPFHLPDGFAETRLLYRDEICAFVAEGHPLADKEKVTWHDLVHYPIISLSGQFITNQKVREHFDKYGLNPNYAFLSSSWQYLMDSVKDTVAVTLLPFSTPRFTSNQTIIARKIDDAPRFHVHLARRLRKRETPEIGIVLAELRKRANELEKRAHREKPPSRQ